MVNTRLFQPGTQTYVLPIQCEHVFYSEVLGKVGWSFVVRHGPRGLRSLQRDKGRPYKCDLPGVVKSTITDGNEEGSLEEEDDDEEHDQHDLGDDDDPTEDVQEIVESDDVADNADENYTDDDTMSVIDDDDDDDMANTYNVDSGSDDTDDDLDEEDDDMDEEDDEV